jgi:cytochrome c5
MKEFKRRCPNCKEVTLRNGMYSEDGTAVFDQECSNCGAKHYECFGEYGPRSAWEDFERKYEKVEVSE